MLLDVRTYAVRPGTLKKHLALYTEFGMEAQKRHLGEPVAYLLTESGNPNEFIHIWAYKDAADRAQRRANMQADPAWQAYIEKSAEAGYLVSQKNSLMTPAPFFPLKR